MLTAAGNSASTAAQRRKWWRKKRIHESGYLLEVRSNGCRTGNYCDTLTQLTLNLK